MEQRRFSSAYGKMKKFNTFCASFAGAILIFVTFAIFYDVIMRYLFNRPSVWITEVSTYLLLYMTFLGTAYALQQQVHIRVTFLSDLCSRRAQRVVTFVTSLFALVFCAVSLWQTGKMAWFALSRSWTSPSMLSVPLIYVYAGMVFGSFMLLLTFLFQLILTSRSEAAPGENGKEKG